MFDLELNTVTLAAIIMTLGMTVDDYIVIIDGYVNNLAKGMRRWQFAVEAYGCRHLPRHPHHHVLHPNRYARGLLAIHARPREETRKRR